MILSQTLELEVEPKKKKKVKERERERCNDAYFFLVKEYHGSYGKGLGGSFSCDFVNKKN
jgi:hypothetical protein